MPHIQRQDIPSNREHIFMMITSFYLIICHSHGCFQPSIYVLPTKYENIINTTVIRLLQNFHCYYYGYCRLLANGMRMFHLECHYCLITVLDRGHWPSHPWYSHRMCLHHILLNIYKSNTMPAVWWNIIWMFRHSTQCSLHPTTVASRWRLPEWFWYHLLTHSTMQDSLHSPHFQHGTCLIQPSSHHTLQYTTNSS